MAAQDNIFPQAIEFGDKTFGDEDFVCIRFIEAHDKLVDICFRPEALDRLVENLTHLAQAERARRAGKPH